MKNIISLWFLLMLSGLFAQMDTVILKDIIVTDVRLNKNKTQFIQKINDSVINSNAPLLTEILNFNTPIYFKENGYGMVSSPSFRGTTASQTAVLWNGIQINSGFLGQVDFNTISSLGYDEIMIKPGGGSVAHGSGAIGGSVHLNHKLRFNQGFNGDVNVGLGSFNTLKISGNLSYSNDQWAYKIGYNRNSSDNDYEVEDLDYINYNGQFYNNTLNANLVHKLNENNQLAIFVEGYDGQRHFSLTEPTSNRTKYHDRFLRSLLQLNNRWNKLASVLRLAFINEKWEYWQNLQQDISSMGELSSFIGKYDGTYALNDDMDVAFITELILSNATGKGSGIDQVAEQKGNLGLMFSHQISPIVYYEVGVRKEMNSAYDSPILFSLGANFQPVKNYEIKANISRNFRAPTFNDLYWEPGSNDQLKAETSMQYELSNVFKFQRNEIGLNLYLNDIKDMIRWIPGSAGYWFPVNEDEVRNFGFELLSELKKSFGKHTLSLNNSYAYTKSVDSETHKQLSYVPFHKFNGTFTHQYQNFSWYLQGLAVGKIFTTADENNDYTVDPYQIFNLGTNYDFGREYKINVGLYVRNLFDLDYQTYPYRIMPPRNFGVQIHVKF